MRSLLLRSLAVIITLSGVVGARATGPLDYRHRHHAKRYEITDPGHAKAISQNPSNAKVHAGLNKRQDYSCGPGRPCHNGACCGPSGWCGYGPLSCGTGCSSNCDAKAECGQYAEPPGKTCPLNVCCSQHGFCGTTSDFCDDNCQSNCGEVSRPSGGGNVRKNVIGYYESWAATSKTCSRMQPEEVPASGMTHLNFAFAFITPDTYDIIPMPNTDPKLFSRTTALKSTYPGLKVWISVGGWTFNDNGTIWQPVFSDLASSQAKRTKFINSMIKFMIQYGFDGCDLDWEYPGAPDRGGQEADYENYVSLMKETNNAFKAHPKKFGLSFTAPTSFWYLRWFDLEKIHPNVDFINVMSYDLHGIWDSTNPIGPQVLGHTNMTEIDLALDLFWRTNVPSSKVHLGFGFYGRSFKLKNSRCSDPGCPFEGPADAGPCTDTAGILSFKEIQSLIAASGGAKPKLDTTAQVKYLTWGSGNWISYDDKTTFEAKVDFGNRRGLNGMLIWAVDQDDTQWNAIKAVTGKNVLTANEFQSIPESDLLPRDCYVTGLCGSDCAAGYIPITDKIYNANKDRLHDPDADFDPKRCGGDKQRSLCCPFASRPNKSKCYWRGNEGHCNGRCHDGEVFMVADNQGDNGRSCLKGLRAFCCEVENTQVLEACDYGECGATDCSGMGDKTELIDGGKEYNGCGRGVSKPFCCTKKSGVKTCNWSGHGADCVEPVCRTDQIQLRTSSRGDAGGQCRWGRQRALCCNAPKGHSSFLPVDLSMVFPTLPPADYDPAYGLVLHDNTVPNPREGPFAMVIVVGPADDVSTFSKRDGSHMELFDCPIPREGDNGIHKAKAVCRGDPENCNQIFKLEGGVEGTFVKMPSHCTGNRYVRAIHLKRAEDQTLPGRLLPRDVTSEVYEFAFDFNFHLRKRDASDVSVRIDYASQYKYFESFVEGAPFRKRSEGVATVDELYEAWESLLSVHPETNVIEKRTAENWREHDARALHPRFHSTTSSNWERLWELLLLDWELTTTIDKTWDFKLEKKLFQVEKTCTFNGGSLKGEASAGMKVEGTAKVMAGASFVGKFTTSGVNFDESYAFFGHDLTLTMGIDLSLIGRLKFDQTTFGFPRDINVNINIGDAFNVKGILEVVPVIGTRMALSGDLTTSATVNWEQSFNSKYGYSFPNHKLGVPTDDPDLQGGSFKIIGNKRIGATTTGSLTFSIAPYIQLQLSIGSLKAESTVASLSIEGRFPSEFYVNLEADSGCSGVKMGVAAKFTGEIEGNGGAGLKDIVSSARVLPLFNTGKKTISSPTCYSFSSGSSNKMRKREYIWDNTTLGAENELSLLGIQEYSHTKRRSLAKRAGGTFYNLANSFSCPGGGNNEGGSPCDEELGEEFANAFTNAYGDREDDPTPTSLEKRSDDHWHDEFLEEVGQSIKAFQADGGNLTDEEYWRHFGLVAKRRGAFGERAHPRAVSDWAPMGTARPQHGPFDSRTWRRVCAGFSFTWKTGKYLTWPNQVRGMTVYERSEGCTQAPYLRTYELTDMLPARNGQNLHMATEHILELQTFNSFWRWVTDNASGESFAVLNNIGSSRDGACGVLQTYFYQLALGNGLYRPIDILALGVFPSNTDFYANNLGEFVILERPTNKVKMSLMGGGTVRTTEYMADPNRTLRNKLTVLKSCLLVFKYLREPTVQANFEAQVRRMGAGLDFLERVYIPSRVLTYQPGGFALSSAWYRYVREITVPTLNRIGEQFLRDNLATLTRDHGTPRPGETQDDIDDRLALYILSTSFRNTFLPFNPSIPP
ncbi:hypothetical protein TWF970_008429 [Orbilia oligospora]|uniref:chitinase n=1 Tax=Orbilia oligospora TaxID=2813651 RepID=A0A7C8VNL6_ORBOL|nr:hypothetical protein TWF970_008429 [Orbilia oligospora]